MLDMAAVIYSRISDDPRGKAAGVERQAAECRTLADARGVEVSEVIVDNDVSATTGKRRPGFERVLDLIRAGAVDTVIVWHTDRLYRLPRDLEPIIALADGRRLRFLTVTASEIDLNTPSGRMVARMLAAASAQEVEHKAERQRSASDQRASRGIPHGHVGYGYRRAGDELRVEEAEAALIREGVQRVLAGESLRRISLDWNARDIAGPGTGRLAGRDWNTATLKQMLLRPSLAGLRKHRGQIVGTLQGESIIDLDTRERLMATLTDPLRRTTRSRAVRHLMSGLAICGLCGGTMKRAVGRTMTLADGTTKRQPPSYACTQCIRLRRKQADVDYLVTETVLQRLERPDAADLFTLADEQTIEDARNALATIETRLAAAADAFADGAIDSTQLARITARLRDERSAHQKALAAALPPAVPAEALSGRVREVWDGFQIEQKRALIDALVTVTIHPQGAGRDFDPEAVKVEWRL